MPADGDGLSSLVVDILSEGGQAIVFVNTRRATESLARKLSSVIRKHLSEKDTEFLHKISEGLGEGQEESTSMAARLGNLLLSRILSPNIPGFYGRLALLQLVKKITR